jgi:uncharacterized protein
MEDAGVAQEKKKNLLMRLLVAVEKGDLEAATQALAEGADVNSCAPITGDVALRQAAIRGDAKMIDLLLGAGALTGPSPSIDVSPLRNAITRIGQGEESRVSCVQLLIKGGAEEWREEKILRLVGMSCDVPLVQYFLVLVAGEKQMIQSMFSTAVLDLSDAIVGILIDSGADLEQLDSIGRTPLMGASASGRFNIVQLLVARGADVSKCDRFGHTPIDHILSSNLFGMTHVPIVSFLLEHGVSYADDLFKELKRRKKGSTDVYCEAVDAVSAVLSQRKRSKQ